MKNNSLFDFAALVIFVILSIALAIFAYSFGGVDFNVYYAAARVMLDGGNPYDFQQLAPQIISSAGEINNPYYYAPWFTWVVIPFSLFPYSMARVLWLSFNYVLWLWALINLSKLIHYPQNGWKKWCIWFLVTFVFAWSTWGSEQVGILILLLFTLIFLFIQRENWVATGICLALILFKPNITAVPAGFISIWLVLHRKRWSPLFVMLGTTLLMVLVSFLITPNWHLAILQPDKLQGLSYTLDSSGATALTRYTTTLLDWLSVYGINGNTSTIIYGLFILFGIVSTVYGLIYLKSIVEFASVVILVNFAVIPYTLFYDYPSLVITLFWGNALLRQYPKFRWIRYTTNASIVLALFSGDIIPYRYWITIILILFLAFGYFVTSRNENTEKEV
jgi:hypothetical protein